MNNNYPQWNATCTLYHALTGDRLDEPPPSVKPTGHDEQAHEAWGKDGDE